MRLNTHTTLSILMYAHSSIQTHSCCLSVCTVSYCIDIVYSASAFVTFPVSLSMIFIVRVTVIFKFCAGKKEFHPLVMLRGYPIPSLSFPLGILLAIRDLDPFDQLKSSGVCVCLHFLTGYLLPPSLC